MARGKRGVTAFNDYSSQIGTALQSQIVVLENDKRVSLIIMNLSVDVLWVNFGVAATIGWCGPWTLARG